jgi:hypothetical protein
MVNIGLFELFSKFEVRLLGDIRGALGVDPYCHITERGFAYVSFP